MKMNWKNLGNATIIVAGLFGATGLLTILGHYCPVALGVLAFVSLVAVIYHAMQNYEEGQQ